MRSALANNEAFRVGSDAQGVRLGAPNAPSRAFRSFLRASLSLYTTGPLGCDEGMAQTSAALALVRGDGDAREILLVHPGGPFWSKKDNGAWSLPKGLVDPAEDLLEAAKREFFEELGSVAPEGPYVDLGTARLKSGKTVHAFAVRGDLDAAAIRSNEIEIDWPPRSGKKLRIPEVDRAGWFYLPSARKKISEGQARLVEAAFGSTFS